MHTTTPISGTTTIRTAPVWDVRVHCPGSVSWSIERIGGTAEERKAGMERHMLQAGAHYGAFSVDVVYAGEHEIVPSADTEEAGR